MKAASFASLLLACVLSPVASDPCLAPICVVNKPCAPTLPSCIRFKEGVTTFKWINITGNTITGQTDAETKLNLHLKLAEGSCQMTIRVVSAHEAKSFRDFCDYERSNASLRAFNEIGQKYRVESAQELRQMMSDGIPRSVESSALSVSTERTISEASSTTTAVGETRSSPNDAMLSTSTVKTKIVDSTSSPSSAKLPRTTTMAPGRGPSSAVEKKTTSSAPVRPKDIKSSTSKTTSDVVLVDDDPQIELDRAYVVVEVSFGEIFEFQLGSDDTFRLQETSPGTRVVVERGLAVGFTIFTEQQVTNEFRVLSSSGRLLIFALHPVNQAKRSLEKQQANHRFITESRKPELDLIKSLKHIRKVAGVETVVILDANNTHIIWIIQKDIREPLFTTTGSLETMAEGMDDEYVITRFELRLTTGDHVYAIMRRTLQIFLIIFLPMFLTFMPVIWYLRKKHGEKCSCSKLLKPSPR